MQQKHEAGSAPTGAHTTRSLTQLQRLLQRGGQFEAAKSLGEALVPFLLAMVEACWFNGILIGLAGVDFLHTKGALLPFWGPPLLLCAALWLFQRVLHKEANAEPRADEQEQSTSGLSDFGPLFAVLALLDVGLIWLRIYAGTNFLLDPRWLLAFANDLLSLNEHFYQALAIVIITVYFCWRGTRLAQMGIDPGHVRRQMWVGLLILLASILLRAGQGKTNGSFDDIVLFLLIPAFFYFVLAAHALARVSFVRHAHPFGLDGNVSSQERAMLSIIGGVGLVLLALTLLFGLFFSTTFLNSLQPIWSVLATGYNWLVTILSLFLAWLLSPLFWLFQWLSAFTRNPKTTQPPVFGTPVKPHQVPLSTTPPGIVFATTVILPLLILLVLVLVVWLALRRRKRLRITRNRASGDVHESVWSWRLFWQQFKSFLVALFRMRGTRDAVAESGQGAEDLPTEPAARTIREIYRALLKKAAVLGYVRRRNETPREFQQRLNQFQTSSSEPQLGQLTEAYTLTRYGGSVPDEFALASARRDWEELVKKWEPSS